MFLELQFAVFVYRTRLKTSKSERKIVIKHPQKNHWYATYKSASNIHLMCVRPADQSLRMFGASASVQDINSRIEKPRRHTDVGTLLMEK